MRGGYSLRLGSGAFCGGPPGQAGAQQLCPPVWKSWSVLLSPAASREPRPRHCLSLRARLQGWRPRGRAWLPSWLLGSAGVSVSRPFPCCGALTVGLVEAPDAHC